jgi:hypothetical protein
MASRSAIVSRRRFVGEYRTMVPRKSAPALAFWA